MIHLNRFNEYGVFYIKPVFPKGHKLQWLNYSRGKTATDLDTEITDLVDRINTQYSDDIYIPLNNSLNPGCATEPKMIETIAKDVYNSFNDIFKRLTGDEDVFRLVYGIGVMDLTENDTNLHHLKSYPILVKVGHELDSSDEPGIYRVSLKND